MVGLWFDTWGYLTLAEFSRGDSYPEEPWGQVSCSKGKIITVFS